MKAFIIIPLLFIAITACSTSIDDASVNSNLDEKRTIKVKLSPVPVIDEFHTITGTVAYKQRIALPPNSILAVKLYGVSLMDVPATLIAKTDIHLNKQQVPIKFKINYLANKIDSRSRYSVQAKIITAGKLNFISTMATPVITHGNDSYVDIMLEQVNTPLPSLVKYNCDSNINLSISFTQYTRNANKENIVIINGYGKHAITLPSQQVGSGFLYGNGKYSLRGKDEEATLSVGRMMPIKCKVTNSVEKEKALR